MIQDEELREEWRQEMIQEAKEEEYLEYHLRSDIDNLREHLDIDVCIANKLLDNIAKQLEYCGYDCSDNDVLEFIRG